VLEDVVFDSSSNKSNLFSYDSNKASSKDKSKFYSPAIAKLDTSYVSSNKKSKIENKNLTDQGKGLAQDAPFLKKKSLFAKNINKISASNPYQAFLKLKKFANKLKISNKKYISKTALPTINVIVPIGEDNDIPSPLLLAETSILGEIDSDGYSSNKKLIDGLKNESIKILKEKSLMKKKYTFNDIVNHI